MKVRGTSLPVGGKRERSDADRVGAQNALRDQLFLNMLPALEVTTVPHEPALTPSLSLRTGEGRRRPGEGSPPRFKVRNMGSSGNAETSNDDDAGDAGGWR